MGEHAWHNRQVYTYTVLLCMVYHIHVHILITSCSSCAKIILKQYI